MTLDMNLFLHYLHGRKMNDILLDPLGPISFCSYLLHLSTLVFIFCFFYFKRKRSDSLKKITIHLMFFTLCSYINMIILMCITVFPAMNGEFFDKKAILAVCGNLFWGNFLIFTYILILVLNVNSLKESDELVISKKYRKIIYINLFSFFCQIIAQVYITAQVI